MKKDKWLKWKIGVVASVGVALLFNEVKTSAAFQQASAQPAVDDSAVASVQDQQPFSSSDEFNGGFTRTRHRGHHNQYNQPGQPIEPGQSGQPDLSDPSSQSDSFKQLQPQTRTRRS